LYLSANKFSGNIPEEICGHDKLEALFLDENQISGSLPTCLGNLQSLKQLYAFNNQLTGQVPVELSSLRQLSKFSCPFQLPCSSFSNSRILTNLLSFLRIEGLGLEQNDLVGGVPDGVCSLATSSSLDFWTDCGGDAPEVSCPCCSVCCPSEKCV
jgi:Leucine-rich repeat (LRR) protein